jgi:hypothetical protein
VIVSDSGILSAPRFKFSLVFWHQLDQLRYALHPILRSVDAKNFKLADFGRVGIAVGQVDTAAHVLKLPMHEVIRTCRRRNGSEATQTDRTA